MAVAGVVPGRGRVAACQARAGRSIGRLSPLVRQADAGFSPRAQHSRPRLVGLWLWLGWFQGAGAWLHAKLALVAVLVAYHLWCGKLMLDFRHERNTHGHVWSVYGCGWGGSRARARGCMPSSRWSQYWSPITSGA